MKRRGLLGGLMIVALIAALFPGLASGVEGVGLPAKIVDFAPERIEMQQHPTTDFGATEGTEDDRVGTTDWRVVMGTGNCCENHLGVTSTGRIFDIAGSYVNYSDDQGVTWKSVQPLTGLINGEGSIAVAPNGDVLAIEWDAYTGDHLLAYKYVAETDEWLTFDNPIHHPVYDRPWITVVPGPFTVGPLEREVPYITLVIGGTGVKEPMFMSTDGLSYQEISSRTLDGLTDTPAQGWLPIEADASFDWIQPIRNAAATPLGGGRALAGGFMLNPDDLHWDAWTLPNGQPPPTFIQIDSRGRIHELKDTNEGFDYRISADNGQSWTTTSVPYPLTIGSPVQTDFHANAAVGIAAVSTRVNNQDWLYKFDITGDAARLTRRYRVGLGNAQAAPGVGQLTAPRFDFQTVAIMPDGRLALSFLDATTMWHPPGVGVLGRLTPVLAIETGSSFDTATPEADLALTATDSPDPVVAGDDVTYTFDVANVGPDPATGVTLTQTLPSNADFASTTGACSESGGTVTCSLGAVDSGTSVQTTVTVTATEPGTLTSTASVFAMEIDPDLSNNTAALSTDAVCTITGTAGADRLNGTGGRDVICGLGGDDRINGLGGNDLLIGGDGADQISANDGDDIARGGAGDDDIKGADGNDALHGGAGVDALVGGAGEDSCYVEEDGGTAKGCEIT